MPGVILSSYNFVFSASQMLPIMNADDVQRKLGLNVLGTLPLEEAEYDGEKERKRKRRKKKK